VPGEVIELPQKEVLTYGINALEELKAELREYGCEEEAVVRFWKC